MKWVNGNSSNSHYWILWRFLLYRCSWRIPFKLYAHCLNENSVDLTFQVKLRYNLQMEWRTFTIEKIQQNPHWIFPRWKVCMFFCISVFSLFRRANILFFYFFCRYRFICFNEEKKETLSLQLHTLSFSVSISLPSFIHDPSVYRRYILWWYWNVLCELDANRK